MKAHLKQQVSQTATYENEIHPLHTELQNVAEKSELQAAVSVKVISIEGPRPTVEAESENLLNTIGLYVVHRHRYC